MDYNYNNPYNPNYTYNTYQQYQQPYQPQQQQLQGYLVDNIEQAKTANIPIGSYGIFPKNDLTEIYIKSWNNNGIVNMLTYKLAEGQPNTPENSLSQISEKLDSLIQKVDTLL